MCTQSFAQNQEATEEFYRLYPDLKAHKEVVQTAADQLVQSGFQATTRADAHRAVAIKAYVLLNKSSGATKIPYWLVLEAYNHVRAVEPALKDMSLQEFAVRMDDITASRAYDEGLNDSGLRRPAAAQWGIVILVAGVGLIFVFVVSRVTARPRAEQQHQPLPAAESIWQQAIRPAGIAAKWASMCGMFSVFRAEHLNLLERIGFALLFSMALALIIALPAYLIAVLSYAMAARRG